MNLKNQTAFAVICESYGNIDHKENPFEEMSPKQVFACDSLKQASEYCLNYIDEFDLGGGNWTGGKVFHPKIGHIANVSYNGKVWKLNGELFPVQVLENNCDLF
jgi:hypothetical protein